MNFKTNKEKGNSGLGMAIAYFTTNGYVVSIPLNDTQDYDLVIEKDGDLKTVQAKSNRTKLELLVALSLISSITSCFLAKIF